MEYSGRNEDLGDILGKLHFQLQGKSDGQSVKSDLVRMIESHSGINKQIVKQIVSFKNSVAQAKE